jgi:hypothetical protein
MTAPATDGPRLLEVGVLIQRMALRIHPNNKKGGTKRRK